MGERGRPSAASLAVVRAGPVETVERLRPPHDLLDEEVEIWAAVVAQEAADRFSPSTGPLLAQYCRHVVGARRVAELLERATADPNLSIEDYDKLLRMQARESQAIATLATKMCIAQRATVNWRGNKKPIAGGKPWEN
jgi:hypothetical protein